MAGTTIPTGLLDTFIATVIGIIFTLIGVIYRKLRTRIKELEEELERQRKAQDEIQRDIEVAYTWMFGREEDPTNGGIAQTIEDGFEQTDKEVTEIREKLTSLIDQLVDRDEVDVDRDTLRDD